MHSGTTVKTTKGYPRVTAGPLRHKYVHRIVAAALIGRELHADEEVHHKDGDKLNFSWNNLFILGNKDHGWVSTKQAWFMRNKDEQLKLEWDTFMIEQGNNQTKHILIARSESMPWIYEDGYLQTKWEERA